LKDKDLYLITKCDEKAILKSTFLIFATYQNNILTQLKDEYYLGYDHTTNYDGIELNKWDTYEKCDIYLCQN
jgi:hypothetical protein